MLNTILEPFSYQYMTNAILISALVGGICAFLSAYLILKGWSLIGDALSHSVVPGVAIAYALQLPFGLGAFFSGFLATIAIFLIKLVTKLKEDAIIGFIFSSFFALGLFIISLNPTAINIQMIIFGNILAISSEEIYQFFIITCLSLVFLITFWKDLLLIFFDEIQAKTIGVRIQLLKVLFFSVLSACIIAALQIVGAILVIAMVVTPGATAYLLTDSFRKVIIIAVALGFWTSALGTYLSYFLNGATGGLIVTMQLIIFLLAFLFAPKHGYLANRKKSLIEKNT